MRILITLGALALITNASYAGEAHYKQRAPEALRQQDVMACQRAIEQAESGLPGASASGKEHAERFTTEARQALKAGDAKTCYARAEDALRWE